MSSAVRVSACITFATIHRPQQVSGPPDRRGGETKCSFCQETSSVTVSEHRWTRGGLCGHFCILPQHICTDKQNVVCSNEKPVNSTRPSVGLAHKRLLSIKPTHSVSLAQSGASPMGARGRILDGLKVLYKTLILYFHLNDNLKEQSYQRAESPE